LFSGASKHQGASTSFFPDRRLASKGDDSDWSNPGCRFTTEVGQGEICALWILESIESWKFSPIAVSTLRRLTFSFGVLKKL
jgi:hypothetical protein